MNVSAVLTGDLVSSSAAEPAAVERAMRTLEDGAARIGSWTQDDTRFTRSRGDGWQIVLAVPELAPRAALYQIARLRAAQTGLETRIALGIGAAESMGTHDLSDAGGPAFEVSGRTLDAMKRLSRLAVAGRGVGPLEQALVQLLAERAQRWTPEQAEAMALFLHPDNPTLEEIAGELHITPQAVSYRLSGAGGREIRSALKGWEAAAQAAGIEEPLVR